MIQTVVMRGPDIHVTRVVLLAEHEDVVCVMVETEEKRPAVRSVGWSSERGPFVDITDASCDSGTPPSTAPTTVSFPGLNGYSTLVSNDRYSVQIVFTRYPDRPARVLWENP